MIHVLAKSHLLLALNKMSYRSCLVLFMFIVTSAVVIWIYERYFPQLLNRMLRFRIYTCVLCILAFLYLDIFWDFIINDFPWNYFNDIPFLENFILTQTEQLAVRIFIVLCILVNYFYF